MVYTDSRPVRYTSFHFIYQASTMSSINVEQLLLQVVVVGIVAALVYKAVTPRGAR